MDRFHSEVINNAVGAVSTGGLRKVSGIWHAVVRVKRLESNGEYRWIQKSKSTGMPCEPDLASTRRAAQEFLSRWRDELLAGFVLESVDSYIRNRLERARASASDSSYATLQKTFAEYATEYVDSLEEIGTIESSTARGYHSKLQCNINPLIGHIRVIDIEPRDIERLLMSLNDSGVSNSTIRKAFNLTSQVMKHAVRTDGLTVNPCEGYSAPTADPPRHNPLSLDVAREVLDTLASLEQTPPVSAARLALLTGMGAGESCALTWDHCDPSAGEDIFVEYAIGNGAKGAYLKQPKRPSRRRTIPITRSVRAALEERRERALLEWKQCGAGEPSSEDYVLGRPGRQYTSPQLISKGWIQIARAHGWVGTSGKPVSFYDLRHTFATRMMSAGCDVRSLQALMGHSTPTTSLRVYTAVDNRAKWEAMDRLDLAYQGQVAPAEISSELLKRITDLLKNTEG